MKRIILIAAFALFSTQLHAQDETVFGGEFSSGGFGGPIAKITSIRGELGLLVGGYGGWLVNHQFMIGVGGYGLVNNVRASDAAHTAYGRLNNPLYVEFGYGGLMLEYIIAPSRLVHFNVQALIGAGGVTYREDWYDDMFDDNPDTYRARHDDALFVLEPGVNVELNMTSWFRIAAGASYRYVNGVNELSGIENKDLGGPSANVTFKFGTF